MPRLVAVIPKSEREEVRVTLRDDTEPPLIEARVYEVGSGVSTRTHKFLLLPAQHAPAFAEALMKAVRCAHGDAVGRAA